jgi:Predicted membrane protein (DUF2142)
VDGRIVGTVRRSDTPSPAPSAWNWPRSVLAALVFLVLAASWALASPVFSVPDEDAHATKAVAQARGQVLGVERPGVDPLVVDLPPGYEVPDGIRCFVAETDRAADCGVELGDPSGADSYGTWAGRNNPTAYALVAWPSLLVDGNAGVYAMRLAGAALGAILFGLAFQLALSDARSRWMPTALAFAAAPMCLFLVGAVNPNGPEILSAVLLWVGTLRLLEHFRVDPRERPRLPRWYLWLVVAVASVILLNGRALGPVWFVVIVAVAWSAVGWRPGVAMLADRRSYAWIVPIAAAGVFSVTWTAAQGTFAGPTAPIDYPLVGEGFIDGFVYMVGATPDFVTQAIGIFGWLDTVLPPWTYWLFAVAFAALPLIAVLSARRRGIVAVAVAVLAAGLMPVLVQAATVRETGVIWQGRYGLVLYLGIVLVAAWVLDQEPQARGFAERAAWIVPGALTAFGLIAYVVVMVRYVIGDAAPLSAMLRDPRWQPPFGWAVLGVMAVIAAVGLVALIGTTVRTRSRIGTVGEH